MNPNLSEQHKLSRWLNSELRASHAGETGAVWIYRGILALSCNQDLRLFAQRHLKTEEKHLKNIEALIMESQRSRFLTLWRVAGFLTGAFPAVLNPSAVYLTITAVETFVTRHYQEQIATIQNFEDANYDLSQILAVLADCQADEIKHRDEASENLISAPGIRAQVWCTLIEIGSRSAVAIARRF